MNKCWCGHSERSHKSLVCTSCARGERKTPYLEWTPHHEFDARAETADELEREGQAGFLALMEGRKTETQNRTRHPAVLMRHMGFSSLSYTVQYLQRLKPPNPR